MHSKSLYGALAMAAALALAACSKPPQLEMEAARRALDQARAVGAETYAAEHYGRAEETLAQVRAELVIQAKKSSLFRSYERTRLLVIQAQGEADKANSMAASGKAQAQQEAQAGIEAARSALAEATSAVDQAPSAKDSRADVEAMKADLNGLRGLVAQAEAALSAESYGVAKQRAAQVRQQAMAIQADIAAARAKAHKA